MRIKQGDLYPFEYNITYDDGKTPINLTGCTVTISMTKDGATEPTVDDQTCIITDAANGKIKYTWQNTETDVVGMYKLEFHVTTHDGSTLTVPSGDILWLFIIPSLRAVGA